MPPSWAEYEVSKVMFKPEEQVRPLLRVEGEADDSATTNGLTQLSESQALRALARLSRSTTVSTVSS